MSLNDFRNAMKSGPRAGKKLGRCLMLIAAAMAAACAPIEPQSKAANRQLVFPPPPEEARFVFERTIWSSADIIPDKSDDQIRRMLTGAGRTGEGLGKPYAVAVHRGRMYVSDTAERVVKVFDAPEGRFFRIGEDDPGELRKPMGLDVDRASGTLYVADATAKAIMAYDRDGEFLKKIGGPGDFDRLSSVSVDRDGKRIFVVDIGGVSSENHRVRVFDTASGNHLMDIGKRGTEPGEFNLPRDVAVGKDGQIYVVDGGNFRIQVFDRDGKYLQAFGRVGKQFGNFARPKEASVDRDGNIYVADAAFGNFQIFNPEGDLLLFVGDRSEQGGPAQYMLPAGIYVDEDGRVFMVDQWFRKVDVFRPAKLSAGEGFFSAGAGKGRQKRLSGVLGTGK